MQGPVETILMGHRPLAPERERIMTARPSSIRSFTLKELQDVRTEAGA